MKKTILLLLLLVFPALIFSQRTSAQEKKEKKKLDSLCKKHPELCADFGMLVGPNSIFNNLDEKDLKPKEHHCFDKKFTYSGLVNNKPVEGCFYINTTDGLVAKREDKSNSCNPLMSFEPGYHLNIYSMRGDAFLFQINRKKQRTFVATPALQDLSGNNTTFQIVNPYTLDNDIAEKFTEDNYPTFQYKIRETSQNALYYLFAPYKASLIPVQDYLGMYGTGYYKDKNGFTILCLSMDSDPQNYIRIDKITDVNECFDGSSFENLSDESGRIENEISDRKKRDLQNRMNDDATYACNARQELIALESLMQEKSDRATQLARSGNISSPAALRILMEGNDVLDEVQKNKLKLQIKLCDNNESLQRKDISPEMRTKYSAEIGCLNHSITQLVSLKNEIEVVENANSRNLGKALSEKNRLYIEGVRNIDLGCNADKSGNIKPIPPIKNPVRLRNNR